MKRNLSFFATLAFLFALPFTVYVPAQTSPPKNSEVNSGNQNKDPFSREIKPSDDNSEFLQQWSYKPNASLQPEDSAAQKQIRMIYLVPSDRVVRDDYKAAVAEAILNLQDFYKKELGNGYTFALHSPIVEVYQTSHPASFYSTNNPNPNRNPPFAPSLWFNSNMVADANLLAGASYNDPNNRWIIYIDADPACGQGIGGNAGIATLAKNDLRGLVGEQNIPSCSNEQPDRGSKNRWIGGLGHELSHTFNVPHPPGCGSASGSTYGCTGGVFAANSLMWVGYAFYPNTYLLPEDKQIFLNSGFFSQESSCTFSLTPASQSFSFNGGNGSASVNTANGCAWTAVSNNSWITVTAGETGSGSNTVFYTVTTNTGLERTGTITIGNQIFTVNQLAPKSRKRVRFF